MSLRARTTSTKQKSTQEEGSPATSSSTNDQELPSTPSKSPLKTQTFSQRALSQTLTSTANLANLLPTGTLLAFQLLTPIFTKNGACDPTTQVLTSFLLALLAVSCFLACFTDSLKSTDGQVVYYGLATFNGIFLFDSPDSESIGNQDLRKYKITFIDGVHAVLSVLVFVSVALKDKNVVNCFFSMSEQQIQEVLDIAPVGIGLICSLLFVVFPTRRHGIGYPVTSVNK